MRRCVLLSVLAWALLHLPYKQVSYKETQGWCLQPRSWPSARLRAAARERLLRMASSDPREVVDLYGMRTRELKAFLKGRGVSVDDCFDTEALIARAAATQEIWSIPTPSAPKAAPPEAGQMPSSGPPSAAEVEAAWSRICEAWPGKDVVEYGSENADKSVILLHGFGDTNAQFLQDTFSLLQNIEDLRLLLPQAPEETLQDTKLQSWFLPTNGQWILDESVAAPTLAYVHTMIRREIGRGISPSRIVLGGFAQGGGLALRAALSFPDAPLGGAFALSSFFGAPSAAVAPGNKGLKALVCHGTDDDVVPYAEGTRTAELLRGLLRGADSVTFKKYGMKHGVASDELTDVLEFINSRMAASEEAPLDFDPAGISQPEEEVAPPPMPTPTPSGGPGETARGVPTMDPATTLELMNDAELMEAAKDPEVMAVMQDVIMFPENFDKHVGNPRVAKILDRIYMLTGRGELPSENAKSIATDTEEAVAAPVPTDERMPDGKKKKVRVPIRGMPKRQT